jgi:hypothetical protein
LFAEDGVKDAADNLVVLQEGASGNGDELSISEVRKQNLLNSVFFMLSRSLETCV